MGYKYIRTPTGIIRYDNNFTDEQRARLDTMEVGAQVNAIIGVKGSAETEYRIGLVSISKANVGLGRADNTPDTEKDVATARTFKTGRDITIGNKTVNFDGSSNISYGLLEIGALPLIGGNMIGAINFDLSQIPDDKVLVLNNIPVDKFGTYMSNILGTGIYASVNDDGSAIKIRTQGNSNGINIAVNSNTSTGINITNNNADAYSIYSRGKNYLDVLILSTMEITGDAEIGGTLTVTGKTTLNDDLDVAKNVDIAGNANIDGTLDVAKKTKLADELEVTKATVLKSTLSITGNTTVGGTLGVTGAATLNSTLEVTGNTTVGGTLGVTGATTLSNTLSVTGATTLSSTLGVSGNTTVGGTLGITGNVTVGSSSTHSSITSNGNLYIKNGNINKFTVAYDTGDTTVGGIINVSNNATVGGALDVTSNTTVGGTLDVTGATTLSSTLDVSGNVTIGDSITHSSTTSNGSLYIKNGNATKFSVAYDTGNTNIDGTLNVTDNTTLNGSLLVNKAATLNSTLGVTGNTTVGGTFGVTGDTTLNSTLSVTGNTVIGSASTHSTTTLHGNFSVKNSSIDKFTVAYDTGNTSIAGTLSVAGDTTLNGGLDLTGDVSIGGTLGVTGDTTLSTLGVTSNATIGGTLGVTGDTTLSSTLGVTGNVTVGNSSTHSNIISHGNLIVKNGNANKFTVVYDTGNTVVGGTLGVTGATTLSSTLAVTGNTTLSGTLGVTGDTTLGSTLGVSSNATIGGTLGVTGATTISDTLTVSKATTLNSTLVVTGNTTVGGTLGVTGATTLSTLDVTGNTAVGGTLGVTGDTTLSGLLTVKANVNADSYSGAINMKNSDIYGLNSIYTEDVSDSASEGIHFYRDTTHVDTLWINGGDLLFVPNRELGVSTTKENSQKVARFTANPTTSRIVVTDGTTGGIKSSYALDTAKTANTVVLRDSDGYIRAEYYNQASNAETPDTSSYIIYANSDGWFRKSSLDDIKVILGLGTHAYDSTNYLALSGGTMSGTINSSVTTSTHINGAKGVNVVINSTAAANGYNMLVKMNSTNGVFNLGYYTGKMHMYYISNTKINNNTNSTDKDTILMDESGNFSAAGSVTAATSITAGTSITANAGNVTATGGYLKSTLNSNTITIGSQNASFAHIYNSANIPFIFNNSIMSTDGTLGNSDYPFKGLYLSGSILYKGTKATTSMIKFKDNTADAYGNGIIIGGGGLTIIGSGESADTVAGQYSTGGSEEMVVSSDAAIYLHTNVNNGYDSRKTFTFSTAGDFTSPRYVYATYLNSSASAETPDTNSYIMYANSDGWLRKSSLANVKSILGLGSAAYTDSTSYAPSSGSNNYVRVYNSSNVGSSSSVTMNDLAKQHFAMAMIYPKANNPTGADKWVHVINMSWNNTVNTSWVSQIAVGVGDGTGMWYRTNSASIIDRAWTRLLDSSNYSSYALPLTGGTLTGSLTIKKTTAATNTYADANPKLIFNNADASQNISLTFSDYDSVQSPASLTLNGNQGGEYFIAPNIKATSNIYVGTTAVSLSGHTHNYAGSSSAGGAATIANKVYGTYTGSGGQQGPSYYGKNAAGFLMSNATVNSNTQYKNWLYMDNYSGADVGGATALGLNRMEPRAYIMQSDHNRTSWNNSTEIVTYYNMGNAISSALTKAMVTTALGYTPPTTNTWRGIQDNLTSSTNTTESLSAKQGYLLANGSARDSTKLPLAGGTMTGALKMNNSSGTEVFSLDANGTIITRGSDSYGVIRPATKNYGKIGTADYYYYEMHTNRLYANCIFSLGNTSSITVPTSGGTMLTNNNLNINGSTGYSLTKTIYAPTSAGTSGQYLKSNGSGAPSWTSISTVPGIKSASNVTTLGWGTNNNYVPDISLLAYWNGAYSGTSSNLAYCSKGAFGTIVTKNAGDYAAASHTHSYLPLSGGQLTGSVTGTDSRFVLNPSGTIYAGGFYQDGFLVTHGNNTIWSFQYTASYMHTNTNQGAYGINWWASDTRLKTNIKPVLNYDALSKIDKINFIEFDWKNTGKHDTFGVSANELQEILPDAVYSVDQSDIENSEFESLLNINDTKIDIYLLRAVQQLSAKVKYLEEQLANK